MKKNEEFISKCVSYDNDGNGIVKHNGIVNILEHFNETNKTQPTHVIGGFHLYSRGTDKYEDPSVIESIGTYLINTKATFYTCHCTGVKAYELLKQNMEDSVNYLSTGSEINI